MLSPEADPLRGCPDRQADRGQVRRPGSSQAARQRKIFKQNITFNQSITSAKCGVILGDTIRVDDLHFLINGWFDSSDGEAKLTLSDPNPTAPKILPQFQYFFWR